MPSYAYSFPAGIGTNEVAVCNRALLRVGHSKPIAALDDATEAARLCNALYGITLEELLASFDWNFARRHIVLTEDETVEHLAWNYAYALPADCLVPREIWSGARRPPTETRIPFGLEAKEDLSGSLLWCDIEALADEAPYLRYTANATTVAAWTPLFADALAWRLAIDLALPLSGKESIMARATNHFELAYSRAMGLSLDGEQQDPDPESAFIRERS